MNNQQTDRLRRMAAAATRNTAQANHGIEMQRLALAEILEVGQNIRVDFETGPSEYKTVMRDGIKLLDLLQSVADETGRTVTNYRKLGKVRITE